MRSEMVSIYQCSHVLFLMLVLFICWVEFTLESVEPHKCIATDLIWLDELLFCLCSGAMKCCWHMQHCTFHFFFEKEIMTKVLKWMLKHVTTRTYLSYEFKFTNNACCMASGFAQPPSALQASGFAQPPQPHLASHAFEMDQSCAPRAWQQ